MKNPTGPIYTVHPRPWPILISISAIGTAINIHLYLIEEKTLPLPLITLISCLFQWIRDLNRESLYLGRHTNLIQRLTKNSLIIFILSETILFVRMFWSFIHEYWLPDINLGERWPPSGIEPLTPIHMPLLNTILLTSSGVFITTSHHIISKNQIKKSSKAITLTILMGITFILCIILEYKLSFFSINDRVFGSLFYIITGIHGSHVIIGTIILLIRNINLKEINTSRSHLLFTEFSIWYWHFVDIIWLFVYTLVYWLRIYLII